jgi:phenylalanyl-tRNA synthetase beta chain
MKFTLSWLKSYLETDASLETITDKLTAVGLELEEVVNPADDLRPFVIAKVVEAGPHPDADKLQVLKVDTGNEIVQVVCGAPNARAGLLGAFAPSGSVIPTNGMKLKPTKIRGVESNGMMCSERELGLGEDHDGIIDLPSDAPIGTAYADYMGVDDPIIEIAITPNRQDALGVYGIARDLAAAGLGTLKSPDLSPVKGTFPNPINVTIESKKACPVFAGRYIKGVKNGKSPEWLQHRLKSLGMNPISILVDITNYMTYDLGRPLHVFDADKVNGDLTIRMGKEGEILEALDDKIYKVGPENCIVADDKNVISLGGVMGGNSTGCADGTVNVYLECAWFDPITTALTGRKLGIESDARYRFERGVDPETVLTGIEAATKLILELCGGEPSEVIVAGEVPSVSHTISFRPERVAELGGVTVTLKEAKVILENLGFIAEQDGKKLNVTNPSWRCDIVGEADLVEEILRIHGFENIVSVPLPESSRPIITGLSAIQKRVRTAKRTAAGRGLREAVTWAFLPEDHAKLFGDVPANLILDNPISNDLSTMRPNLLPNLITAAQRNADRGAHSSQLFEAGNQFSSDAPEGQHMVIAGIRRGLNGTRHWTGNPEEVNAYDAKADAEEILRAIGVGVDNAQVAAETPAWYHPGRSGVLKLGPKNILAYFGEIHPKILKALDVKGPIVAFEIMLGSIPLPKAKSGNNRGPLKASDYQAIERDFAFVVDKDTPAGHLLRAVKSVDKNLIENVNIFDIYEGLGENRSQKSVGLNVRLQPKSGTLTDEEIEAFSTKLIETVVKKTGATLR